MKNFIKKAVALIIVLSMTLASVTAFAAEAGAPEYLSLRDVVEGIGGTAEWDSESALIVITLGELTLTFSMSSDIFYLNGEVFEQPLSSSIINNNDRAYISVADAVFLFGAQVLAEEGEFGTTIATTGAVAAQIMEIFSIPGMTVAIVDAETGFTWVGGFGYADTSTGRPVDGDTLFQIASTSKPMTAVAVMQLAERGLLDIDAPITNFIPEFSQLISPLHDGDYSEITARMLLSNTSGITVDRLHGWASIGGHYPGAVNDMLAYLAESYMAIPADTAFIYANAGWTLLGILVARVAGHDDYFEGFAAHANENIFAPLGMNRTSFIQTEDMLPYLAMFYNLEGVQDPIHFTNVLGAGSVVSSANEMATFMHMILNRGTLNGVQILSEATVNQMLQQHDFDFSVAPMAYGLGFMHSTGADGFQSVGHGGTLIHHHTFMEFNLESGIGVFVSVNSATGLAAAAIAGNAILQTAIVEKTGDLPLLPSVADADATPIEKTQEELAAFEGVFSTPQEMWHITAAEGYLTLHVLGTEVTLEVVPLSDGSFDLQGQRLWFVEYDGELLVVLGEAKALTLGARLDISNSMANETFEEWMGTYYLYLPEGLASAVLRHRFFVNELGMAVVQNYHRHGLSPISALTYYEGSWFMSIFPINFELDEDGVASYQWFGSRFVRVAE